MIDLAELIRMVAELKAENAKLQADVETFKNASSYWWCSYYAVQGENPPHPNSSDAAIDASFREMRGLFVENAKLRESVSELLQAMRDYVMENDGDPTSEHRAMTQRAVNALDGSTGSEDATEGAHDG